MITTPAWVALGAPLPTAVAADKVAGTLWTLAAARTYLRRRPVDRTLLAGMAAAGLAGAAAGALLMTAVDEGVLRRVTGVLLMVALLRTFRPFPAVVPATRSGRVAVLAALPLGLYEGLLGSGNAIFTTVLLRAARGWDLLTALGHYYALAAMWCALAAAVYFARGAFDPGLAIPASLGALGGGALGARVGRAGGSRLVRPLFLFVGVVLAARLLSGL